MNPDISTLPVRRPAYVPQHVPQSALRVLSLLAIVTLAACSTAPQLPVLPDGANRVPVNRDYPAVRSQTATPALPERQSFVLDGKAVPEGKAVRVSLFDTLAKIAGNTGLRFQDNGLPDEYVSIVPNDDPLNVLRQLARKSRYRISLDREKGRLWVSEESKKSGLLVLRDSQPVIQVGAPVALKPLPDKPVPLIDALRLLAPSDFDIGHAESIDPNIRVDLTKVKSWLDGLESVALQTPYRLVFDWERKVVYVVPVSQRGL